MDRDLSCCAHDSSSSDTKSGSDGGNRGGPGAVAEISGFRILDVHNLRVGEDGTDQGPEHIVVVKVEPEFPDDSFSQGEMGLEEAGCLYGNALRTSNGIQVKEELNEDSLSADEKSTTMFRMFSWTKNVHTITERSLQQDQKSHCAMSKEYEQKCRLDQVKLNIDTCEKTDKDTECNKLFSCSSDPQEYMNTPSVTCINSLGQNSTQQVHVSIQKGEVEVEVEVDTLRTGRTPFDHVKHTSGRHNQLEEQCKCSVCNKYFSNIKDHRLHMRTHTDENPYECNMCSKSLASNQTCQIHMDKKPYKCIICSKSFTLNSTRKKHMRTHTGEKPYNCSLCNKSFSQNTGRQIHMMTHTGEKPYKCNVCNGTFYDSSGRRAHMRTHTGEKPFKCSFCGKSFKQYASRMVHMRTHTGEKPYKCNICSKSFTQNSTHKQHMRTHTGEKPYNCSVCNKSFSQNAGRQIHMMTHTGEKAKKKSN